METPDMSNFQIADHVTVISIRPLNDAARQWLDENVVSELWQWVHGALCVEARFARDLIIEIAEAGFEVTRSSMPSPDASRMRRGCGVAALLLRHEGGPYGSIPQSRLH